MPRALFLVKLAAYGVDTFRLTQAEVERETRGLPELICNTSPIQYLHQLGLLDLLRQLGGPVTVPAAVAREINDGRAVAVSLPDLAEVPWITIARPASAAALPLVTDVGPGEAEVLALGLERRDAVLVLDDAVARRSADTLRLRYTGTLGILLDAKKAGFVASVPSPLAAPRRAHRAGAAHRSRERRAHKNDKRQPPFSSIWTKRW
jgi:predicted nucleic acid-binding protein